MCEAEDRLREVLLWLRKNHIEVSAEWSKIQADKAMEKIGIPMEKK